MTSRAKRKVLAGWFQRSCTVAALLVAVVADVVQVALGPVGWGFADEIIDVIAEWLFYDFPAHNAHKLFDGKYRGQRHKWIALRFMGEDDEIKLAD